MEAAERRSHAVSAARSKPDAVVNDSTSPASFEGFFADHHPDLFSAVWLITRNGHETEEIVQEAFLRLWERWERVSGLDDPEGYLYRTAMNVFRSRKRRAALALRRTVHAMPPDDGVAAVERRDALVRALALLTPRERAAVVLTNVMGSRPKRRATRSGSGRPPSACSPLADAPACRRRRPTMTRERHAVLETIRDHVPTTSDAFERLTRHRERRARAAKRRATVVGSTLAIAIVAGAVTAWWTLSLDDARPGPATAAHPAGMVAGADQYYYVRFVRYDAPGTIDESGSVTYRLDEPRTTELWAAPDGSGRVVSDPAAGEREATDRLFPPGKIIDDAVAALPTDPDAVIPALSERSLPSGASPIAIATTSPGRSAETTALLRAMEDLLTFSGPLLTPLQQAALLEAAATIPDVSTETALEDPLGRPATKLTFVIAYGEGEPVDVEWYVDPVTGQFLGQLVVEAGSPARALLIEAAGIADSSETPAPADELYVAEARAPRSLADRA